MPTVFINERPVVVADGATARDAVLAVDPALRTRLDEGEAYLTDGRGIRLAEGTPLVAGAIVRVVISARRAADPHAHA